MYSLRCGLYLVLLLIPTISFGAVTYDTVRISPGVYAPNGATQHDVTVATRRPDGVIKYHNVKPVMQPSTLGRLGRRAIRGGVGAVAVGAVIDGLGYLIDQATGDIKKVQVDYVITGPYVSGTETSAASGCFNDGSLAAAISTVSDRQYVAVWNPGGTCSHWQNPLSRTISAWNCNTPSHPFGYEVQEHAGRCYSQSPELIETYIDLAPEDYEIIDTGLADQLTLQQKTDLARRILTMTNSEIAAIWPELASLAEAVRSAEQAVWDALTDPAVIPTPEQETIVEDGRYTLPDQQTDTTGGIWPAFCEWATFICAPFQESEHPPLPTVDIDPDEYDSGLPNTGVCPAPVEIVTNFGQWEISYDPACQFAESIRVPLLAISYLIAGFIVVGVRR